jgi:hypothetical protein
VTVDCDFGYEGMFDGSSPRAYDSAAVPGRMVEVTGRVMGNGSGLAGVPVVLTGPSGCPIAGRTTTDQDGRFTFGRVQAGEYAVYALPEGWTFKAGNNIRFVSAVYGQPAVVEFWPWPGTTWPHTQPPRCPVDGGPWG